MPKPPKHLASSTFRPGDPRAAAAGRKGAARVNANKLLARGGVPPFTGDYIDVMEAAGMRGPGWAPWRSFGRAMFGLPMSDEELTIYRRHTGRARVPAAPVAEAWMVMGRRSGKSRNAAVAAAYLAIRRDYRAILAPGERAAIPVIAADRKQAGQVLRYLKGLVRQHPFDLYVSRVLKDAVEFRTGVTIEVATCSFRTVRGYTVVGLVADEVSFWRSDVGSPGTELEFAL